MKKLAVLAALAIALAGPSFAQTADATAPAPAAPAATPAAAPAAVKTETAVGTIVSFKAGDSAKGITAVLTVKVGGKVVTFTVDAKTVITGKDKKAAQVSALKAGASVEVTYTVDAAKANVASAVTLK